MAATYVLGPFRLDAETDTLFRGGEPVSLGHRAVALLRVRQASPLSPPMALTASKLFWPSARTPMTTSTVWGTNSRPP